MSTNPSHIKLPECPICIEQYNLIKKRPFYICRNSHSICKQCYHEHKFVNASVFCPICKCDMNFNPRENCDIVALLTLHEQYAQGRNEVDIKNYSASSLNRKNRQDMEQKQKLAVPRIVKIALLFTGLCVFPLIFVLISQFSYIIINFQTTFILFLYQTTINLISTVLSFIWTFIQGFHSTCETLFIYSMIFHIIYVIHMILVLFSLVFVLKLCAQKFVDEQWKVKGKTLRMIELPKNKLERVWFVVLVNFIQLGNRVFQIEVKNEK